MSGYQSWLKQTEASLPLGEKVRRQTSMLYRSKGERRQIAGYYKAEFTIDMEAERPARLASAYHGCTPWRPANHGSQQAGLGRSSVD